MTKRKAFTLSEKLNVLKEFDEHPNLSKVALAAKLNIPVSTLKTFIGKRGEIEKNVSLSGSSSSKRARVRQGKYACVEEALLQWFQQARASNYPVSGPLLIEKAKEISAKLNVTDDFSASAGWLHNFKKRHGITCKKVCGESGAVDGETVRDWKDVKLPFLIKDYAIKDIFNADETGLFFNLLPDRTLGQRNDTCHGGKKSKERLTVLLIANADGTEKLPPLVIGKFAKPRCFKNVRTLPTNYTFNKKAWVTTKVFEDWLRALDAKMGAKNRKIILIVDQCSAHPPDTAYLRNVRVQFFPANCTSELQPLDLGIIQNFKTFYRKQLLRRILQSMGRGRDPIKTKVDVLQAMTFIAVAWGEVKPETIAKCFRKAGFVKRSTTDDDEDEDEDEEDIDGDLLSVDAEDWERVGGVGAVEDYLSADRALATSAALSIDDIVDEIRDRPADTVDPSDIDTDDEAPLPPKFNDAMAAFEIVKRYVTSHEVTDKDMLDVLNMQSKLYLLNDKRVKQQKISAFFK